MNRIAFSMHHRVIKTRRSAFNADLYKALGVLAYAKAFECLCGVFQPSGLDLSVFQKDAIYESINAKIRENDFNETIYVNIRNWRVAKSVGYRALLIAFFGIFIAIVAAVLGPYIAAHPSIFDPISEYVLKHLFAISTVLVVAFAFGWTLLREKAFLTGKYNKDVLKKHPILRDLLAVSLLKQKSIGVISVVISAIVFALVIFDVFQILR